LQIDPNRYYRLARLLAVEKVLAFETTLQELLHLSASFHQTGDKIGEVWGPSQGGPPGRGGQGAYKLLEASRDILYFA
ncbi:MAG: hypothetical protein AAF400_00645, partial [Bacteroidota bacterium]